MNKNFLMILLLLPVLVIAGADHPSLQLSKIKVIPIKDSATDRQYELYVKLPAEYEKNKDKAYPVIYFTDALWHVEILSGATEFLMPEAILVGISWQKDIDKKLLEEQGEHVSRFRDYTVRESNKPDIQAKYQLGQAHQHLNFLRKDVISTIEKSYRTQPDQRSYFGYSAGGLFGAYILMAQPDTFTHYILGSPSVDSDIELLSKARSKSLLSKESAKVNVFISYGSLEKDLSVHVDEFIEMLKTESVENFSIDKQIIDGTHQTAFPMTSVQAVTWLSSLQNKGEKE